MPKALNLKGQVFGRLTVLSRQERNAQGTFQWLCACTCGNKIEARGASLKAGNTLSCGCLQQDRAKTANTIHGGKGTAPYLAWKGMTSRVGAGNPERHLYFDKGIRVCDRWALFQNFLKDMGPCPVGLTLDRYPNREGNYEPGNCRWATPTQQARNTKRTLYILIDGKEVPLADYADSVGMNYDTARRKYPADHFTKSEK